jgi:hypothetical protein
LYYPCGKKFEGQWKAGKKNGRCIYTWPNGARYNVIYIDGKKQGEGMLENTMVSLKDLKSSYSSHAKKSVAAREFMKNPPHFIY